MGERARDFHAFGREIERGGDDRGTDHRDEDGRDLLGEPRQHEQEDQDRRAEHEGGRVGLVEVGEELANLVEETVRIGGEAEQLG